MANLRLVRLKVLDSTSIRVRFTEPLSPLINTSSVIIVSNIVGVPDAEVLKVTISGDTMDIKSLPMTPFASYFVTFKTTSSSDFKSVNGNFLFEDGTTNAPLVLGQEDPDDPIREFLINLLKDNVYNLDTGTLVRTIVNGQSTFLAGALHDIGQAKNDNYLLNIIPDERKTRGGGPYDRLNEEGAFKTVRVGQTQTNATLPGTISFASFPSGPITLQAATISGETLMAGTGASTFDRLTLTVLKRFVTKLLSVSVRYASDGATETYDIATFGYQVLNPRYDQAFASPLLTLTDTQFQLSDLSFEDDSFRLPIPGDVITVSYEFKNEGKFVDEDSVMVSQVLDAVRESTLPIATEFSLSHAPVVTANDTIAAADGVTFLDPESNPPFTATHPAFAKEIPFRTEGLPKNTGEYAVDYTTGRVFTYGAVSNDGTGNFPPTATYKYRSVFRADLDYTYDTGLVELVTNPLRDLTTQIAKISFDYEQTLIPEVDFKSQIHKEVLAERINNRLNSTNSLSVLNVPVTNVFRIFNETTGEVYKATRFNNEKVYFNSNNQPRIFSIERERATFADTFNETLLIDSEFANVLGTRVLKILLQNNNVISSTEDVIAASYNTSVAFSRADVFVEELYFDAQVISETANTNRLTIGRYQVDYRNGIIFLGVSSTQTADLGSISYKKPAILSDNNHLISVSELYHSISTIIGINKRIALSSFSDTEILPNVFDIADERFLNGDTALSYLVLGGTITVQDDIKNVRNIYDAYDLNNNATLTNFAEGATVSANVITLDSSGVLKQDLAVVQTGLVVSVPMVSPAAEIFSVISVTRTSDNVELFDGSGSFTGFDITLSGLGTPVVGEIVQVTYRAALTGAATPIVDYNRGDYFVDYTYLADEIIVSYEYGDNVLDFREGNALDEGDEYFVTYHVGALRDALLKNFGSLIDIPVMQTFDTTLPRESYRDALKGALQSFTKGPTIPSMKSLVSNISHIEPDIIEAAFQVWSLGVSHLYPNVVDYTGDIQLLSAKFDNGALVSNSNETITFPVSSNLKIEDGTLEFWTIPDWNGLDNDATLTFQVLKDGYIIDASEVFIGASSFNPTYDTQNKFTVNRLDDPSPIGLPSKVYTDVGFFVYYNVDDKRWNVLAKEKLDKSDGYMFSGTIESSGEVYDVKFIPELGEINDVLRSGTSKIEFEFNLDGQDVLSADGYTTGDGYSPSDGYVIGFSFDGISLMADDEHYLFDFGETESINRFSLYKDGKGYLNFRVQDRGDPITGRTNQFKVSADISDWLAGQRHHIAAAWKLNTSDRQDEMHLFIDGEEVPNILKFGGRPVATSTDRFRTVKPELVVGVLPKNAVAGNDLSTTAGSTTVTSESVDFSVAGIVPGDTINIRETGFGTFTIVGVSGGVLILSAPMTTTLSDARFSVNEFSSVVATQLDLFSNLAVSIIDGSTSVETEIPGLRAAIPAYTISKNSSNEDVLTILGSANAGDTVVIRTLGLNHRRCRETHYVWGNTNSIIKTQLPSPISLDEVKVLPVLLPLTPIGPDNAVLIVGRFFATGLAATQPSNVTEGRTLSVRITGGNVSFSTPPTVTINGTTVSGPLFETLTFTSSGTQTTTERFLTVTSVDVATTPLATSKNSIAVEIKEELSITVADGNTTFPVIRFSYQLQTSTSLAGTSGSTLLTDTDAVIVESFVDNLIVIKAPAPAAGSYTITDRIDNDSFTVTPALPATFTGGEYDIFNISVGRSGFQNGWFVFEEAGAGTIPFPLKEGLYEFDYSAYMEVKIDPVQNYTAYIGSDLNGNKQSKAIIDEFRLLSGSISDVRVGETLAVNEKSVTVDFTTLTPFSADSDTLMLLHFNSKPFENSADFWVTADKTFLQSGRAVNDNFGQSLVVTDKGIRKENKGLLSTISEGSIEFWASPRFDTHNDPATRFYFDASSSVIEEVVSITNTTVKASGSISSISSVRLQTDIDNTGIDFFAGGTIEENFKTIKLGKALPSQRTPVKIGYVPLGLSGDRISIYKDGDGFIVFNIRANGVDYQVRQFVFWARDTWHRIRATYKLNRADNQDELRLFVDGEERGTVYFGLGLLFGQGISFGQGFAGADTSALTSDINFTDPINDFFIGSDFLGVNTANARIDNLRLSNRARSPLTVAGQDIDINYSTNLDIVFPVIEDAFTTFLWDFDAIRFKTDDLSILRDEEFGIFNFTLNVIDSFDIVLGNAKIQQVLESLVFALKPAQSKIEINYIQ
ncbi:hypothetical protein LCGC14_0413590 [marine sediment metagenome]|uniref:Uncharacterized protein n=1 Tax=marine sediment metagenome TaxID=412755 RepID=A0A0F9TB04_9ZZZZ